MTESIKQEIKEEIELSGVPPTISPVIANLEYLKTISAAQGIIISIKIKL